MDQNSRVNCGYCQSILNSNSTIIASEASFEVTWLCEFCHHENTFEKITKPKFDVMTFLLKENVEK